QATVASTLREKMSAVGEARGRLAHVQFAWNMLEKGAVISVAGEAQHLSSIAETEVEIATASATNTFQAPGMLRDEHVQMLLENRQLREDLAESRQQLSRAAQQIAQTTAVLRAQELMDELADVQQGPAWDSGNSTGSGAAGSYVAGLELSPRLERLQKSNSAAAYHSPVQQAHGLVDSPG
ncbi:unnamed protein product, partial [Polarella glacialis]